MKITIENTTDALELAKLNESVQNIHHELYPEKFKPFNLFGVQKAFVQLLLSENVHAYLAKYEGEVAAYLLCIVLERKETEFQYRQSVLLIDQVCVLEKYRRKGIAKELLKHSVELAQENDIKEIEIDYWEKNRSAYAFFAANGFENQKHKMVLKMM